MLKLLCDREAFIETFIQEHREDIERAAQRAIKRRGLQSSLDANVLQEQVRDHIRRASEERFAAIQADPAKEIQKIAGKEADEARDLRLKDKAPSTRAEVARRVKENQRPDATERVAKEDDRAKKIKFVEEARALPHNERFGLAVRMHNPNLEISDTDQFAALRLLELEDEAEMVKNEADRIASLPEEKKGAQRAKEWRLLATIRTKLNGTVAALSDAELTRLGLRVIVPAVALMLKIALVAAVLFAAAPASASMVHSPALAANVQLSMVH